MNIPEEFGKYLLLKKLTEDPLGETFRAGKVGKDGMEQVVLLRVFNGKGVDGEKLWQKTSGRANVQQSLKSPNIGSGVDLGRVRSFPYTAYDYISGKNLAVLLAQANRQLSPIPTDHALLIAERLGFRADQVVHVQQSPLRPRRLVFVRDLGGRRAGLPTPVHSPSPTSRNRTMAAPSRASQATKPETPKTIARAGGQGEKARLMRSLRAA